MANADHIINDMKETQADLTTGKETIDTYASDNNKLQHYFSLLEVAQEHYAKAQAYYNEADIAGIRNRRTPGRTPTNTKHNGKPNVQVYQQILELHGRPMYITDILHWARSLGVEFHGAADPKTQLRSALNGAKGRFTNVGNNTWWLADTPVPENPPPSTNGNHSDPRNPRTPGHSEKE